MSWSWFFPDYGSDHNSNCPICSKYPILKELADTPTIVRTVPIDQIAYTVFRNYQDENDRWSQAKSSSSLVRKILMSEDCENGNHEWCTPGEDVYQDQLMAEFYLIMGGEG